MGSSTGLSAPDSTTDLRFAREMIPHHQQAVRMAAEELAAGTDPELRRLAERISTSQTTEIAELRGALSRMGAAEAPVRTPLLSNALLAALGVGAILVAPKTGPRASMPVAMVGSMLVAVAVHAQLLRALGHGEM